MDKIAHFYNVFGWNVSSEIELSELWGGDPSHPIDIVIRKARLPELLEGAIERGIGFQIKPRHYYLMIEKVAKFHVIEGNEILIDIHLEAQLKDVKVFLYASVFGGLCHLRGTLPLHASAIVNNNKAYLFTGNSGSGKSTTVAALQKRGYSVLTDDLAPIKFNTDNQPIISQGISRIKLWGDALARISISYLPEDQIRDGVEKFQTPVLARLDKKDFLVRKIFILEPYGKEDLIITELKGKTKIIELMRHTFRTQLIDGLDLKQSHFENMTKLINQVQVFKIKQPRKVNKLEYLIDQIEQHLEE
jgi:hypothetical protein